MIITASIQNSQQQNHIIVATEGNQKNINIPAKANGQGSAVNGGELLFLALATCFCNDVYREAARREIEISSISVTVSGNFGNEGEPATGIQYSTDIQSTASKEAIATLIADVDKIAEIHNTLRKGVNVTLQNGE